VPATGALRGAAVRRTERVALAGITGMPYPAPELLL